MQTQSTKAMVPDIGPSPRRQGMTGATRQSRKSIFRGVRLVTAEEKALAGVRPSISVCIPEGPKQTMRHGPRM